MTEHPFTSERPIQGLAEDQLGRKDFATALAKVIDQWTGRDSLVLAIYGPWGSGKSSLKNMVLDALKQSGSRSSVLEFTPWEWAAQDKVFEAFFAELSGKLGAGNKGKDAAKTAKKVRVYAAMLSAAASITTQFRTLLIGSLIAIGVLGLAPALFQNTYIHDVTVFLGFAALIGAGVLSMSGEVADKVATYLAVKSESMSKSIGDVKNELKSLLAHLERSILVVIDDLDRLTPDEIRMVFQLVKANADFPSLMYLLLFQRETVESALSRNQEIDGPQFLSKIVQVGFDIPKISRKQLEDSVEEAINEVVQDTPAAQRFDSARWGKLFASSVMPYFQSLRDVKRFGNALSFQFELYKNGGSFDANPVDLIALEILRQHEAPLYEKLHGTRELLTGQHGLMLELPDKKKKDAEVLLELAKKPLCATGLLESVFPPLALAASDAKTSVTVFRAEWLKELRACHPEMFERYFRFSLAAEDLSERELGSLLSAAGDRNLLVQRLKELNAKGLLRAAVARLHAYDLSKLNSHVIPFITALLDMERELIVLPSNAGAARAPVDIQSIFIVSAVLHGKPIEMRGALLREAIRNTTALFLPMISFESSEEERRQAIDPLVSEADAQLLKEICVNKVRKVKLEPDFISHPRLRTMLQFWANWASEQEVSTWFKQILTSDSGLFSLLSAFTEGMNDMEGNRILRTRYRFALEDFMRYTNIDEVAIWIHRVSPSDSENQVRCRLFLRAFDQFKATGQKPYPQNLDNWTTLDQL